MVHAATHAFHVAPIGGLVAIANDVREHACVARRGGQQVAAEVPGGRVVAPRGQALEQEIGAKEIDTHRHETGFSEADRAEARLVARDDALDPEFVADDDGVVFLDLGAKAARRTRR